ncbi:MAG: 3-hydroxybutyrate dehydrogenase [Rhizobiaceae bacterium]
MTRRTAIVTGSTSGIGLAVARSLAEAGNNILLNGFGGASEIEAIVKRMASENSIEVRYSGADMTKPDEIKGMVDDCHDAFGSVDILVNNAGIQYTASVEDFPAKKWDQILAINLSSNFHAIQVALPYMKANRYGRIVNIASAHGHVASVHKAAYVTAKHGVLGLTKVVALENARTAITCNAVSPGFVLTPLVQKQIDALAEREGLSPEEANASFLKEKHPSGNFVLPEQIGQAVIYLCSEAASEIRGTTIVVDAGWLAQ